MSMRKFLVVACLLAASVEASADRPDSYSGVIRTRISEIGALLLEYVEGVGRSRNYSLVGETDNGTYVFHSVDGSDGFVALHELLLLKPVSEAGALYDEKNHTVTLGDRRYVIEKLETIPVDVLNDTIIDVEGNAIVVTIASP